MQTLEQPPTSAFSWPPALRSPGSSPKAGLSGRIVAITALSSSAGCTTVATALATREISDDALLIPAGGDLSALEPAAFRARLVVVDLPSTPPTAWLQGLALADDVLVLVRPTVHDLTLLEGLEHERLPKVGLVACRVDANDEEHLRGLAMMKRRFGARLSEVVLYEDTTVAVAGARTVLSHPHSKWTAAVRQLGRWLQ